MLSEAQNPIGSIPAQIVTNEIYDEEMGIEASSTIGDTMFSISSLHEAEDLSIVDPFDRELDKYLNANVLKYTGTTFDAFLMLPRDKCDKLLKRCDKLATKEAEEAEAAMNPLRQKIPVRHRPATQRNKR